MEQEFKTEAQLQAAIVVEFSQKYPEQRGRLFMVNNRSLSPMDGIKLRSMGMFPGVSDLCYLREDKTVVGLEVKLPGKAHKTAHVQNQFNWGANCAEWYVLTKVDDIHAVVLRALYQLENSREAVDVKLKETKAKTIKF